MSTDTDVRPAPATPPAPARVVDLRDRPSVPVAVPARRARLARLQALEVQRAALLHAQVSGRRRTPRAPG